MKFNEVVERIEKISWEKFIERNNMKYSLEEEKKFMKLALVFLHRFAVYIKKYNITCKYNPFIFSVVNMRLITEKEYDEQLEILKCLNVDLTNKLPSIWGKKVIVEYLNLIKISEKENVDEKIQILEPMIVLIENGVRFNYREHCLELPMLGMFPVSGDWVERWSKNAE